MLDELHRKRQDVAITTTVLNGWILMIAAPIFFVVAAVNRSEDGILVGLAGGLMFLVAGSLAIAWGRRSRRRREAQSSAGHDCLRRN